MALSIRRYYGCYSDQSQSPSEGSNLKKEADYAMFTNARLICSRGIDMTCDFVVEP